MASYGDTSFVFLNGYVGKTPNPFSQLLCAKYKPCAPGTYKLPSSATAGTQRQCGDCEIGTFQPRYNEASCLPCPSGFYGVKPRSISETDGCLPCPPGTQGSGTSGKCSVCAPGTVSNGSSCVACPGPNATASCPGGAAAPYTAAQREAALKLLPTNLKSTLEGDCRTHPARFVRTAGTSVVDGADNPNALLSPVVLSPVAVLVSVAIIILLLHSFIPEWLWSTIDFTAQFHQVPQGGASVRENTPLGSAFTLAFAFLASALAIVMHALNQRVEVHSLVPPQGAMNATNLKIWLGLPVGNPYGNDTSYCAGIAYVKDSFQGMTCDDAGGSMSFDRACTIVLTGCRFTSPSAKLDFSVPWFERFVSWSVSVDSTAEATEHQLSGVVTSGDASRLVWPKKDVVVAMQAQPAFLNDTTNPGVNRHGFHLNHLPCVPPVAVNITDGWSLNGPDLAWHLTLELRASQTVYETVRSMKQDPMQLATGIFTTILAVMGVWKTIFSFVEGPVSALQKRLTWRRQMPRKRRPSDVELQPSDRKALLARVISNSKPDDSAAQAAVKEERNARRDADEELHEKIKQQDEKIKQLDQEKKQLDEKIRQQDEKSKQHDEAIRQLTQKFELMTQA